MNQIPISIPDSEKFLVDLVSPNLDSGPWIAGGAVLRWLENKPLKNHDLDVFCKDHNQLQEIVTRLRNFGNQSRPNIWVDPKKKWSYLKYNSSQAETWKIIDQLDHTEYSVQVIKSPRANFTELLDQFDIRVCKMVTDGKTVIAADGADLDFQNKQLTLCEPLRTHCIQRLVKYMCYGYSPDWDQVQHIIESPQFPQVSQANDYNDI
jgi:hypothetical protein